MTTKTRIGWRALILALLGWLATDAPVARAADWYVATNGVDNASGGSNSNPWATITFAKSQAKVVNGDTINLGAGVFTEVNIDIDKNITVQGQGMDFTILQAASSLDTSQARMIFTDMDGVVTLRGITFRHASNVSGGSGGVVVDTDYGRIVVDGCRFVSNHVGGGTYSGVVHCGNRSGSATQSVLNCEFMDNGSYGAPGIATYGNPMVISNCVFVRNSSAGRGFVGNVGSGAQGLRLEIRDSLFISNSCAGSGAAVDSAANLPTIRNCTFAYNSASNNGGAIAWRPDGRGAFSNDYANLTFYGNRAANGGGIYSDTHADPGISGSMTLDNCTLHNNSATNAGGGIYSVDGTRALRSTIVAGNTAPSGPDCYNASGSFADTRALVGNNSGSGLAAGSTNANGSYIGTAATNINPRVKPLYNLGGPMPVCGLYSDSVAIDHGYNPLGLATDQRGPGYPRVLGATNDIGAFEWSYVATPVIQPDLTSISTNMLEDGGTLDLTALGLSATDADGTNWMWSNITTPSNGAVSVSGTGTNPVIWTSFTYTPNANFNGTNRFVVQVADNAYETDSLTVTVAVAAVNDPPVCTVRPSAGGEQVPGGLLTADAGVWNDAADTNVSGSSTLVYGYEWQYSATNDGSGVTSLGDNDTQYTVASPVVPGNYVRAQVTCTNEGVGTPAVQVVVTNSPWILILASNAAPVIVAENLAAGMYEDSGTVNLADQIILTASDADGDDLTWTNATMPAHGVVAVSGTGTNPVVWSVFTYTPATNYYGTDSFLLRASDGKGGVASVTVTVEVAAVNDRPVNTVAPGFTGTNKLGNTITATNGVWNDNADTNDTYTAADFASGATFAYQWWRADNAGGSPSNAIEGATVSAYTLGIDDKYKWIAVSVSCVDSGVPGSESNTAWSAWLKESTTPPVLVKFTNALENGAWGSYSNWAPQDVPTPAIGAAVGDTAVRSPVTAVIGAGDAAAAKVLRLGNNAGAQGTLEMSGGTLTLSTANPDDLTVGYANNSTGTVTQTGGAMSGGYSVAVGGGAGSYGSWTMSGSATKSQANCLFTSVGSGQGSYGEWTLGGGSVVTGQAAGAFNFASGSGAVARVTVQDSAVYYVGLASTINMASGQNSDGKVEVKGGRFRLSNGNSSWNMVTGAGSRGRLLVTGGSVEFPNSYGVGLATHAASTGVVEVTGGTLATPALGVGPGAGWVYVTNNGVLYVQNLSLGYAAGSNAAMVVADIGLVTNTSAGNYGLRMGMAAGNVSTLDLRGGGFYSSCGQGGNNLAIGYADGSTGLVTITGGSHILASGGTTENGTQSLGAGTNALGRVVMSGGSLTLPGFWAFGYSGRGELLLSGGTFTKNDSTFYLGRASGGYGLIEVTGGTWRHGATLGIGSVVAGATGVVRVANCVQTNITGAVTVGGGSTAGDRYGLIVVSNATLGLATPTVWTNGFVELTGTGSVLRCGSFTCRGGSLTNRVRAMSGGLDITGAAGTALVVTNGGRVDIVFEQDPVGAGDFWGLRWAGNNHAAALAALTNANVLTWNVSALYHTYQGVGIYTNATDTFVGVYVARIVPRGMVLMVK